MMIGPLTNLSVNEITFVFACLALVASAMTGYMVWLVIRGRNT
ncbi:hypothetical protein [Sphingomonas crocodyli]|nr:hypothetical protein [Sphingomonas crocodyli]